MNEVVTAIEVQAEIIAKLRSEKMHMAKEIEALKARIAELEKPESEPSS